MIIVVLLTALVALAPAAAQQTCPATAGCNFNQGNIELLNQVIEWKVNRSFAEEPSEQPKCRVF